MDDTGINLGYGQGIFVSSKKYRSVLGPAQPPLQSVPGFFPGGKATRGEVDLSPPPTAEVKKECDFSVPQYALMTCTGPTFIPLPSTPFIDGNTV